jgi:putative acetyltransferase
MPEFGASGPGFAIQDPEVDQMFEAYSQPRHRYFVVAQGLRIFGGGGIAPLSGGGEGVCELRKMYFLPEIRGLGLGQKLMDQCLMTAESFDFQECYLETLIAMEKAQALYLRNGFIKLPQPMGSTGHFSCDSWYLKKL